MPRIISFDFPIPRVHCGVPLGNGMFGALIWGDDRICVTVSRSDFWDHRDGLRLEEGETYRRMKESFDPADPDRLQRVFSPRREGVGDHFCPTRLPAGRFEFTLKPGCRPGKAILDIRTGRLTIRMAGKRTHDIVLTLSAAADVLWLDDPGRLIRRAEALPSWKWVGKELAAHGFAPPESIARRNVCGWTQSCPADPALAAVCRKTNSGFAVCLARGGERLSAAEAAEKELDAVLDRDRQARRESDVWWRSFWKRCPEVNLPAGFFDRFLDFALYKFACLTNPHSRTPAGLQGPWIEECRMPSWYASYTLNVNVQQTYSPAYASNNTAHLLPLFDMLDSWRDVMRRHARILTGVDDGLSLPVVVDDRGALCGGVSAMSMIDQAATGWLAQLYWHYYLYTGDTGFLRDRAFPFMKGAMRVYEEMLERKDGRLSLPIGVSPEYLQVLPSGKYQRVGRNPSYQLACVHMLAEALLRAGRILDERPRKIWTEIRDKLPRYTLIKEDGLEKVHVVRGSSSPRVGIWKGLDLDMTHRHHSHLAAIYPFDSLGKMSPEEEAMIRNSIRRWIYVGAGDWIPFSLPWAAIIFARTGHVEEPFFYLEIFRRVFLNEGWASVHIPRFLGLNVHRVADLKLPVEENEEMQIDGTMGVITALYEMLVHNRGGVTRVFPAVPREWRDVSFSDIRVPGPFLVSAEMKAGCVRQVKVASPGDGLIVVDVPGLSEIMLERSSGRSRVTLPAAIKLKCGETAQMRPALF